MRFYLTLIISVVLLASCHQTEKNKSPDVGTQMPERDSTYISKDTIAHADTISIAAVGDIMLGTTYPDSSVRPPHDGKRSFDAVLNELQQADIAFGNLEGVLLDTGKAASFKLHQKSAAYLFKMPRRYATILKDAGFDILSIGNNHTNDFGPAGRKSTMQMLDSMGIKYAGLKSNPSVVFEKGGVKYGFCGFSPNSQTVSLLDYDNAAKIISNLKQQADIVIVSFHGGGEGTGFEHVTRKYESFKGENRGNVYEFAHNAIDAGADVVLGHGPHLTRAVECYKNRFITYSMGNFCTYNKVSISGVCGIAPLLKLTLNKKGEFLGGHIIATRQTRQNGVERDTANRVIKRMQMLTRADFADSAGLVINNDGRLVPLN